LLGESRPPTQQQITHNHFYDNGTADDTWSGTGDDDDEPDDDEEDDDFDSPSETSLEKASERHSLPHYGGTPTPAQPASTLRGPDQSADPNHLNTTAPEGGPLRTRFDD
jgi:hypothetical protein